MRLDDNEIRIFCARRANVSRLGAWKPCVEGIALRKSIEGGMLRLSRT